MDFYYYGQKCTLNEYFIVCLFEYHHIVVERTYKIMVTGSSIKVLRAANHCAPTAPSTTL